MKKQILLFIIFLLVLFSKNVLFHSFVLYDSMPGGFWQYFAAKFSVVLLICSLLFVTRTPWWTVVVLILTDIWAISNWMYYQSYGLFLSVSMISMANNLHGFSNSIFGLWDHRMFYFIIPTVLYSIALFFLPHPDA